PNFVKIAALMAELQDYPEVETCLIHTGQHFDEAMSGAFFKNLDIPTPDVNLGVKSASHTTQTAEIMLKLEAVFSQEAPTLVVVVGDVNSTLAGTVVAVKMGIPVAHVEAGLRSFDRTMPEEINRVLTDAVSDLLFTTEPSANEHLRQEGIPEDRIHHVGNLMIDTLFRFRERARESLIIDTLGLVPGRFVVLTLHRPSNVDDAAAFERIVRAIAPIQEDCPIIFPVHPRTHRQLARSKAVLDERRGLKLSDPLPYLDFIHLMANARCVLTDSGGIQEETTALGIPCLTLRTTTERPITVTHGTNRIVGTDAEKISEAWHEIVGGRWPTGRLPELWDGKAASRIVRKIRHRYA
ncbi:MAG TPA: UDP-N-acetylglucosamine 2-epimerase (non-hydrolyzing), partial [Methylomirabilota bacterium]|nr:UDP-N-acetylglucosamine 2-epimerase (non-hydrolyzing) [Methylomirabilota bacterium]